jgi:D-alanine-D-alanine ligase
VRPEITIVYNYPFIGKYEDASEADAVMGILECVDSVEKALIESGFKVHRLSLSPPLDKVPEQLKNLKTELIFNLFEGFFHQPESEAEVATIFEDMGLVFTGCPSKTLLLALDKAKSKSLLASNGIAVPDFQKLTPASIDGFKMAFPCIVKPNNLDASHGITQNSIVTDYNSLKKQVNKIYQTFNCEIIVESFLSGREFNVCVMGNDRPVVLPASEIVYNLPDGLPHILTFEAKWHPETEYFKGTIVECPARIDEEMKNNIDRIAADAFRLFQCSGYARVDFRLDNSGNLNVIEVNPNPDISSDAGAARQSGAAGMTYTQFINKIAMLAAERVYV